MIQYEEVRARGHPNIVARHKTTFEITREESVTRRGDCIIGVNADKSAHDLSESFKNALRNKYTVLVILLEANDRRELVVAQGSPDLLLSSREKIIVRKSTYLEPATIGVRANKSAGDLDRGFVEELRKPDTVLRARLYAIDFSRIDEIQKFLRD